MFSQSRFFGRFLPEFVFPQSVKLLRIKYFHVEGPFWEK